LEVGDGVDPGVAVEILDDLPLVVIVGVIVGSEDDVEEVIDVEDFVDVAGLDKEYVQAWPVLSSIKFKCAGHITKVEGSLGLSPSVRTGLQATGNRCIFGEHLYLT
jgi:hypothetical protein